MKWNIINNQSSGKLFYFVWYFFWNLEDQWCFSFMKYIHFWLSCLKWLNISLSSLIYIQFIFPKIRWTFAPVHLLVQIRTWPRMNCLLMLELRTSQSKMATKSNLYCPYSIIFLSFWDIDKVDYILGIDRQPVLTSRQLRLFQKVWSGLNAEKCRCEIVDTPQPSLFCKTFFYLTVSAVPT